MSPKADFAVNGRFLTQRTTGVQRYARNVLAHMNAPLVASGRTVSIIAPRGTPDLGLEAMPVVIASPSGGHAWEQMVLPSHWSGRLLNLCNTAPVAKRDQVVCIHDASVFTAPDSYAFAFRAFYRRLQPLLAHGVARLATVSKDAASQIARYLPVRAESIVVLPNGHEHALSWNATMARDAPAVVAESVSSGARGYVLAMGSRARHKNLRLLMEMAPHLAELGLDVIVAGGGNAIFASETLGAAPNVRMIGSVADHDLAYLMDNALCLAFPSWTEGFGLPIVEAMTRGCPVVSSDRASMPEVCGEAALLAAPDDPATWGICIRRLVDSSSLRDDLAGRGRERARLFSWADTATGYLDLMQDPARRANPNKKKRTTSKVAVAVATYGRPDVVSATVRHLIATQTRKPDAVILSCARIEDAGDLVELPEVRVVIGPAGLARQRNHALDALPEDIDVVAFFDDDFVTDASWLGAALQTFQEEPDTVALTGLVLADGVKGPGLSFEEAVRIVQTADLQPRWSHIEPYSPYGCNMAFRLSAVGKLRFDERLVLYGWLEDRDFGATLAKRGGRLLKCASARGVHMGVKGGRVSGERLGYSQIVNPIYMLRKGTMTTGQVADHVFRNIASNAARALRPEPFIDRRGRLKGNLRGMADVISGRIEPERAAAVFPQAPG